MLSAIRPLLTDEVKHWLPPIRDVFGQALPAGGSTTHRARVIEVMDGHVATYTHENLADAKAIIWLLDHPRPVGIGDTFELASGTILKVIRAERRIDGGQTLTKAYLS